MHTIKTFLDLQKAVCEKAVMRALDDTTSYFAKELVEYVEEELYRKNSLTIDREYKKDSYERTKDFLNSIVIAKAETIGNTVVAKIYIDNEKLLPQYRSSRFDARRNITNGEEAWRGVPINEQIWKWINYGQDSKIMSYDGIDFEGYIINLLEKEFSSKMKYNLKKQGL